MKLSLLILILTPIITLTTEEAMKKQYGGPEHLLGSHTFGLSTEPGDTAIIAAFEKRIVFFKTAKAKQIIKSLGVDKGKANYLKSLSKGDFDEFIREENIFLYENILTSIKANKVKKRVVSEKGNECTIAFFEADNEGLSFNFTFVKGKTGWSIK